MKRKKGTIFCMIVMTAMISLTACGGLDNGEKEAEMLTGEPLSPSEENVPSDGVEESGENVPSGEAEESGENVPSGEAEEPGENMPFEGAESIKGSEKLTASKESLKSILLGMEHFICTDLADGNLSIEEIGQVVTDDESITVSAEKFALIDLDGDGEEEAVLWIMINHVSDYGFEVLHVQNGEVYGYMLSYREFMNLKTDGTFIFSGGAADFGTGKIIFSGMEYTINKQVYSRSEYDAKNELTVQYFTNGESCSADEFDAAMDSQEQKEDVKWYELSDVNINTVF